MSLLLNAVLNLSVGFLASVLAIPLITKGVGRNGTYGFRFESSFQSDEAWYAINSYGGKWILFWSLVMIGLGSVYLAAHFIEAWQLWEGFQIAGVFAPCLLLISGIQASIWADKHFPKGEAKQDESFKP